MQKCVWEKTNPLWGTQNWDEYRSMLAFEEFPGILENFHEIPGHVGRLWYFVWLEDELLFTGNSRSALKENNVEEDCAVHPWS